MRNRVKLNSRGIEAVAKSREVRAEVDQLANEIAKIAKASSPLVDGVPGNVVMPVEVESYTTDRARASVTLAHPSGIAVQAKHGTLTRAAAQAGVEVKSK